MDLSNNKIQRIDDEAFQQVKKDFDIKVEIFMLIKLTLCNTYAFLSLNKIYFQVGNALHYLRISNSLYFTKVTINF